MSFSEVRIINDSRIICPIEWFCRRLDKKIKVSLNPIYINGWVCDCGDWINSDDIFHEIILWGFAEDGNNYINISK